MSELQDAPIKPERELLWQFAPRSEREALRAFFGIEQQLAESLRSDLDHSVAHVRLAWWQEELQRLLEGAPRHPLTQTLARIRPPPPLDLRPLADCASVDLACLAFENRSDLDSYLNGWSASLFCSVTGLAPEWGARLRELELLTDFFVHAWQGRIYWPLGHDPAAADPWRVQPLAKGESDALHQRMQRLEDALRQHAREATSLRTASAIVGQLWSAVTVLRARASRQALPAPIAPQRFAPLSLTISVWWCAVQLQRGQVPTILQS